MERRSIAAAALGLAFVSVAVLLHLHAWLSTLHSAASRTVVLVGGNGVLVEPPEEPGLRYTVVCIPGGPASPVAGPGGSTAYLCPQGTRAVEVTAAGPGPGWLRASVVIRVSG